MSGRTYFGSREGELSLTNSALSEIHSDRMVRRLHVSAVRRIKSSVCCSHSCDLSTRASAGNGDLSILIRTSWTQSTL
jgi:hypothetical protein